ncbi:ABC transporter permease [Streptomyces rimosus]|uniref:ABC transporter permease n=1 Tax=Streptomyces rimosus TaxID=1927 RepID=UPI000519B931
MSPADAAGKRPAGPLRRTGLLRRTALRLLRVLGLPLLLILGWWAYSVAEPTFYLPTPGRVATAFTEVWFSDRITEDVLPSVGRLLTGYALAGLLGVGLGVAIGSSRTLRAAAEPVLEFFRAVPPPVLVPLIMLLAGLDTTMKVLVIVSGCVWPVLLNTVEGVRAVDEVLADTGRCFGLRGPARLRHLVLPAASPQIMAGLRQALSIGIILMVIGEMFASTSGIGHTVVLFQRGFAIPEMWSGIVVLGLLGFGLSLAFRAAERRILAWHLARGEERGRHA